MLSFCMGIQLVVSKKLYFYLCDSVPHAGDNLHVQVRVAPKVDTLADHKKFVFISHIF